MTIFYREKPDIISIEDKDGKIYKKVSAELGKISYADVGLIREYPFLCGLNLCFEGNGTGVATDFNMNMSSQCTWTPIERKNRAEEIMQTIYNILEDSKKNRVKDLIGTPIEMYYDMSTNFVCGVLIGFRILKEVL